jgi:hypothetical protein
MNSFNWQRIAGLPILETKLMAKTVRAAGAITLAVRLLGSLAAAEAVGQDDSYNLPPAVTSTLAVDDAMQKMETAVQPEILAAFKQAQPAPFWLFGEDRQLAVRNNIIPAHWFENGAKAHGRFAGVVRPGEFYVFQVCVIGGDKPVENLLPELAFPTIPGATTQVISHPATVKPGEVKPFWMGIQVPADAKAGEYRGAANVGSAALLVVLKVDGPPIAEAGTGDAWRLARLKWLDSTIGESETQVTRPFTPVIVHGKRRTLDILGRRIMLGENGIPAQFTSYFSGSNTKILKTGRDAFASAPKLEVVTAGKGLEFKPVNFKFTRQTPVGVEWAALSRAGEVQLRVTGRLEFDGNLQLQMRVESARPVTLDEVRLVVPYAKEVVKYAMGLGLKGGLAPARHEWKWNLAKNQDAVWLGDVNIGTMLRFEGANYRRPLINAYYNFQPLLRPESWGGGEVTFETKAGATTLIATSGRIDISNLEVPAFNLDWDFTPFKPLAVQQHFSDRYYHAGQGSPVENTAELHQAGATIMEIHHNRLCNPYINYPFNDDSIGRLTDFIKQAHTDDLRVAVYYTTRELTQNLPEFFALDSLAGEVILPRREGVAWPVTNPQGPHPWLAQHVGLDIVPAWRENLKYDYRSKLDLAVITTPDSRWNNFYLEGLDYLVRKAGIDGLYIDDTALDRKSMQRARRILDADENTGRRMSMHSWNHFNSLAGWANSSIAFLQLYPYLNGLWHGEGFNAKTTSPEFMLVEMSGIPYGLMSEMLASPNPWHGMVFGMRTRWPWSGDPREQWKFEQAFGIADSEFIGWFDPACPVKTDNPNVKVSVFRRHGKTLIAVGNWGQDVTVKLAIDWKALGLKPAKATLTAPPIEGLQSAATFAPASPIFVPANQGWLIVADSGDH